MLLLFAKTSAVNAQPVADNTSTLQSHYIDYESVKRLIDYASQPSLCGRVSDRLFGWARCIDSPERNFSLQGGVGVAYTQWTSAVVVGSAVCGFRIGADKEIAPLSYSSFVVMASLTGFYRLDGRLKLRPSNRDCIDVEVGVASMPTKFWGIGDAAQRHSVAGGFREDDLRVKVGYMRHIAGCLSLGLGVHYLWLRARECDSLAMLYMAEAGCDDAELGVGGVGFIAKFEDRLRRENPLDGIALQVRYALYPSIVGTKGGVWWQFEATMNYFKPMWQGGLLAMEVYADAWSCSSSWLLWPRLGGEHRMRGYYYGRYVDSTLVATQVELRQKIYRALSGVAWVGAGSVVSSLDKVDIDSILPSYGIGLRLRVGEGVLLRADYGFGRNSNGLIISVNEAF